mmetsp:Transcript_28772/g.95565  ORF Transcript_28772/g.95565 Transcript_28772/m.95565 type:complete len:211 (-) Transcript_28772:495-1127(-)
MPPRRLARRRADVRVCVHHPRLLALDGDGTLPPRARETARQPAKLGRAVVGVGAFPQRRGVAVAAKTRVHGLPKVVAAAPPVPLGDRVAQARTDAQPLPLRQHDSSVRSLRRRTRPLGAPPRVRDRRHESDRDAHGGLRLVRRRGQAADAVNRVLLRARALVAGALLSREARRVAPESRLEEETRCDPREQRRLVVEGVEAAPRGGLAPA